MLQRGRCVGTAFVVSDPLSPRTRKQSFPTSRNAVPQWLRWSVDARWRHGGRQREPDALQPPVGISISDLSPAASFFLTSSSPWHYATYIYRVSQPRGLVTATGIPLHGNSCATLCSPLKTKPGSWQIFRSLVLVASTPLHPLPSS